MAESITPGTIAVTAGSGVLLDSVSLTVNSNAVQSETVVIRDPGNASQYAEVNPKGTQADNGLGVQHLHDAGRTLITLYVDNIAGITTEALATLNIVKGGTNQTAATSYTVTSGKTLRIQSFHFSTTNPSTTNASGRARIRFASTVAANSPIAYAAAVGGTGAAAQDSGVSDMSFSDGLEIAGGLQIGISHIESSAIASGVNFCLVGFEY
jgi:hypothetical protein